MANWLTASRPQENSERMDNLASEIVTEVNTQAPAGTERQVQAARVVIQSSAGTGAPAGTDGGFLTAGSLTSLTLMVPAVTVGVVLFQQLIAWEEATNEWIAFSLGLLGATLLGFQVWPNTMSNRARLTRFLVIGGLVVFNAVILAGAAIGINTYADESDVISSDQVQASTSGVDGDVVPTSGITGE